MPSFATLPKILANWQLSGMSPQACNLDGYEAWPQPASTPGAWLAVASVRVLPYVGAVCVGLPVRTVQPDTHTRGLNLWRAPLSTAVSFSMYGQKT